jgi:hypothetical protein
MQQPEMYLNSGEILDAAGKLKGGETVKFLDTFIDAFGTWVRRINSAAADAAAPQIRSA